MQRGGFLKKTKCPKCGGSMYLDTDGNGWYQECLQCGYISDVAKMVEVRDPVGNVYSTK